MPRFSANLSMLFTELPFLERFGAAARAGFPGVEFLFPYSVTPAEIREQLDRYDLELALFNMPAGDWAAGERGLACHPGRIAECRRGVHVAIEYARALGCTRLHCMAGVTPPGVAKEAAQETYLANLRYAGHELAQHDLMLLIEAINIRDIPGFFLSSSKQAFDVIEVAEMPNLRMQYDVYHMQIMEGDLAPTLERRLAQIGHLQVADTPGRHEPGTGEINYPFLFEFIDRIGYTGWIGCEYRPATTTVEGLRWLTPYLTDTTFAI